MAAKKHRALYQLKVTLCEVEPAIWRRIQVWEEATLAQLHRVLQIVMGWEDYHLYEFRTGRRKYRQPHPENERNILDTTRTRIRDLLPRVGARFEYVYDFGDGWHHDLLLEAIVLPTADFLCPRCIAGERSGPPEDVGGPPGYARYLAALADPTHSEHEEMLAWRGSFNPETFVIKRVNQELERKFRLARKKPVLAASTPNRASSPEAEQLPRARMLPASPRKERIRISPADTVPLELSDRERELILSHTFADESLTNRFRILPKKGEQPIFRFTLDDLDELAGFIAAEANHGKNKVLQKQMGELCNRIEAVLDKYTDELN